MKKFICTGALFFVGVCIASAQTASYILDGNDKVNSTFMTTNNAAVLSSGIATNPMSFQTASAFRSRIGLGWSAITNTNAQGFLDNVFYGQAASVRVVVTNPGSIAFFNNITESNILVLPVDTDPVGLGPQWNDPTVRDSLGLGSTNDVGFNSVSAGSVSVGALQILESDGIVLYDGDDAIQFKTDRIDISKPLKFQTPEVIEDTRDSLGIGTNDVAVFKEVQITDFTGTGSGLLAYSDGGDVVRATREEVFEYSYPATITVNAGTGSGIYAMTGQTNGRPRYYITGMEGWNVSWNGSQWQLAVDVAGWTLYTKNGPNLFDNQGWQTTTFSDGMSTPTITRGGVADSPSINYEAGLWNVLNPGALRSAIGAIGGVPETPYGNVFVTDGGDGATTTPTVLPAIGLYDSYDIGAWSLALQYSSDGSVWTISGRQGFVNALFPPYSFYDDVYNQISVTDSSLGSPVFNAKREAAMGGPGSAGRMVFNAYFGDNYTATLMYSDGVAADYGEYGMQYLAPAATNVLLLLPPESGVLATRTPASMTVTDTNGTVLLRAVTTNASMNTFVPPTNSANIPSGAIWNSNGVVVIKP